MRPLPRDFNHYFRLDSPFIKHSTVQSILYFLPEFKKELSLFAICVVKLFGNIRVQCA